MKCCIITDKLSVILTCQSVNVALKLNLSLDQLISQVVEFTLNQLVYRVIYLSLK